MAMVRPVPNSGFRELIGDPVGARRTTLATLGATIQPAWGA